MSRLTVNAVLIAVLLATAGKIIYIQDMPGRLDRNGTPRGCDFHLFYIAAWMIEHGEADRLYDYNRMQEIQREYAPIDDEHNPPDYLFYPPFAFVMLAPLARLPYEQALNIWWLTQAVCFLAVGWLLRKDMAVPPAWRPTAWLALLAFFPLWATVLHGQMAALLVLALVAGFCLQRQNRPIWAGLVLSMLAMKPQFFVGVFLWLLLRRDWRAAGAMLVGLACQLAAVAAIAGPSVITGYINFLPTCSEITLIFKYSAWAEHGLANIVQHGLVATGCSAVLGRRIGTGLQLLVAAWAGWTLYRIAADERSARVAVAADIHASGDLLNHDAVSTPSLREQSCAVFFTLLLIPHVLTYDFVILATPLVFLWSSRYWKLGVVLYAVTSVLGIPVYETIGFSVVPFVLIASLYWLAHSGGEACCGDRSQQQLSS